MLKLLTLPFRAVYAILKAVLFPWYLRWILAFPWFVYLALAIWFGWLAYQENENYTFGLFEAEMQVGADAPMPTPLSRFDPSNDISSFDEVTVEGLYFTAMPTGEFDPLGMEQGFILLADDLGREVKAALVVRPDQLPELQNQLERQGTGARIPVVVNGTVSRNSEWAQMIAGKIYVLGVPAADEVVVIRPFLGSRAAAIYDAAESEFFFVLLMGGIAALLASIGIGKYFTATGKKRSYGMRAPAARAIAAAKEAEDKPQPTGRTQAASPWGGAPISPTLQLPSEPVPVASEPLIADEDVPPLEPAFESVFPGGGSGFRFKSADEIIRQSFGTVSLLTSSRGDAE